MTYVTKSKRKREATKSRSSHPRGWVWRPQAAVPFPEEQSSPRSGAYCSGRTTGGSSQIPGPRTDPCPGSRPSLSAPIVGYRAAWAAAPLWGHPSGVRTKYRAGAGLAGLSWALRGEGWGFQKLSCRSHGRVGRPSCCSPWCRHLTQVPPEDSVEMTLFQVFYLILINIPLSSFSM